MADLHQLRFTRPFPPYMPGEVAAFPEDHARKLVEKGVAVPHAPEPTAKPAGADEPATDEPGNVTTAAVNAPPANTAMTSPRSRARHK